MTAINSPFRYAGGKFYARKLILEHLPHHTHYIEPFAGGGSIFFAKPLASKNWLNDADKDLMNVYEVIRDQPEELINFLKKENAKKHGVPSTLVKCGDEIMPATKDLHRFFKLEFAPKNDLEKAGRWFYLNRTSYSGIMNFQNMYWGYGDRFSMQPKNWPRNITRTSAKLQKVKLTCLDFEKVLDNAPNNAFAFIDPPYFNADQDKFYNHAFTKDDHFRLEKCIKRNSSRLKIFITYDNIPEVREMYSWITEMHDKEWNYCIQRTDDQKTRTERKGERYKGQEIFLLNYHTQQLAELPMAAE